MGFQRIADPDNPDDIEIMVEVHSKQEWPCLLLALIPSAFAIGLYILNTVA